MKTVFVCNAFDEVSINFFADERADTHSVVYRTPFYTP